MKLNSLLVLAVGVLALAGCTSVTTKVNTGPIQARTFNFLDRGVKSFPIDTENRAPVHAMIQAAITKGLAERGVTRVTNSGDLTVAYLVIVGDGVSTRSINDYFGYSGDALALQDKAHAAYTGGANGENVRAGTLLIDLVDNKTQQVLKRGYATRPILRSLPDDAKAARIQEVVNEILSDVRFAP